MHDVLVWLAAHPGFVFLFPIFVIIAVVVGFNIGGSSDAFNCDLCGEPLDVSYGKFGYCKNPRCENYHKKV